MQICKANFALFWFLATISEICQLVSTINKFSMNDRGLFLCSDGVDLTSKTRWFEVDAEHSGDLSTIITCGGNINNLNLSTRLLKQPKNISNNKFSTKIRISRHSTIPVSYFYLDETWCLWNSKAKRFCLKNNLEICAGRVK